MKNSVNILLLGLGGVGFYLAKRLSYEGHAVTVVERDRNLIRRADGEVDARLIRADAMSFSSWVEADANEVDYLIAVTDHDAVNIMGALIADRCGIRRKIARVRSLELWQRDAPLTAADVKIDLVIRPEELTAQEIARLLKIRAGNVVIDIAEKQMQVLATRIGEGSPLAGTKLFELTRKYDDFYFRVVSIARGINTIIPTGDEVLQAGDNAFILARSEDLPQLMQLARVTQVRRNRVLIIGGGLIGSRVAELLEDTLPVRLVENDEARAEELSHGLKRTEVLHGDGSDRDILIQAGLLDSDTIIAATGNNETNIMACVMAKSVIARHAGEQGERRRKTIALVDREEYLVLASSMGADVVLSKKVMAANEILKYIRRGQLLSVAHLHGFEAEVVELVAGTGAPITRRPLYQVEGLKGRIIIGGLSKGDGWQTAVGSTHIEAGDKVITKERFTARNRDAITYLWVIYLALNLLQVLLLCLGGMSLFDSLCHAFGTVSTSGYSPYNASIGHYDSSYFDWVIIAFMFLGGVTFMLFYHAARGDWRVIRANTELRWYVGFITFFCITVSLILWRAGTYDLVGSLRFGSFQVTSLLTTTGFTTADYELWPQAAQMLLVVVCFIGACAGSTTSGIKVVHYVLILKFGVRAIKKIFFQPLAVLSVRMNGLPVEPSVVYLAVCYFIVNVFMVLGGGVVMTLTDEMDALTAMSAIIAALMNIGPGFGAVGPSENYAFISDAGKWFLAWNMLVGRLEMFSALVIFYPSFWRR